MLKHIHVRGDEYECGVQLGAQLHTAVRRRLDRSISSAQMRKFQNKLQKIHETCLWNYPQFVAELRGIARGAQVDYWHILLLNAIELRSGKTGCTSVALVDDNRVLLSHNEDVGDGDPDQLVDCALVTYRLPDNVFTAFTYAGDLPGIAYAWNKHGLFFSVNYLEPRQSQPLAERVPRNFSARALINAKNIKNAVQILNASPDASGFHYYVGQGNKIISVEQSLSRVSVKNIRGTDAHVNHYTHSVFTKDAPDPGKSSRTRQRRLEKLLRQDIAPLTILSDRANKPYTICRLSRDKGRTLSTVQFISHKNKVVLYKPHTLLQESTFRLM